MGAAASGAGDAERGLVLTASVSAAIALAVSSAVGAFEAERVEKKLDIGTLERAMLTRLSEEHKGAFRFAAYASALVHGIAPLIAALPPVVPFLLLPFQQAIPVAVAVTLVFLFAMGAYLGSIVRERLVYTGLRFVAAGLATAAGLWLLPGGVP